MVTVEEYVVTVHYPHRWSSGPSVYHFDSLEDAKLFAETLYKDIARRGGYAQISYGVLNRIKDS